MKSHNHKCKRNNQEEITPGPGGNLHLLCSNFSRRKGMRRITVGVIQVKNIDSVLPECIEKCDPSFIRPLTAHFPPKIACVKQTTKFSTKQQHNRTCWWQKRTARQEIDQLTHSTYWPEYKHNPNAKYNYSSYQNNSWKNRLYKKLDKESTLSELKTNNCRAIYQTEVKKLFITGAMVSVDCHDLDNFPRSRWRWNQGDWVPEADIKDADQGEVEIGEFEGEEFGSEAGAEEWALGPFRRQALGVIRVQVSQKVDLAAVRPPIHRNQAILHPPPAPWDLQRPESDSKFQKGTPALGGVNIFIPIYNSFKF